MEHDKEVERRIGAPLLGDEADQGTKQAAKIQGIMERATTLAHAALDDPRKDVSIGDINRLLNTVVKAGNFLQELKKTAAREKTAADLLPSMTDKELFRELTKIEEGTGETEESDPLALPKVNLPDVPD